MTPPLTAPTPVVPSAHGMAMRCASIRTARQTRAASLLWRCMSADPFRLSAAEQIAEPRAPQAGEESVARPATPGQDYGEGNVWGTADVLTTSPSQAPLYHQTQVQDFTGQDSRQAPAQNSETVETPHEVEWDPNFVNTVYITGVVGAAPSIKNLSQGQRVAQVSLGVQTGGNRPQTNWHKVDFWGYQALQVAIYVRKGDTLAITGRLKVDTWVKDGNKNFVHKVVADSFMRVVDPPHVDLGDGTNAAAPGSGLASQAPVAKTATGPSLRTQTLLAAWSADPGAKLRDTAAGLGVPLSSAYRGLVECVSQGVPIDVARLATELHIGPPGSPWLTVADIASEVQRAQEAAAAAGKPSDLDRLRLKPIREALAAAPATTTHIMSQELQTGSQDLTYAQLRLVVACLQRGIELNIASVPGALTDDGADFPSGAAAEPPF